MAMHFIQPDTVMLQASALVVLKTLVDCGVDLNLAAPSFTEDVLATLLSQTAKSRSSSSVRDRDTAALQVGAFLMLSRASCLPNCPVLVVNIISTSFP